MVGTEPERTSPASGKAERRASRIKRLVGDVSGTAILEHAVLLLVLVAFIFGTAGLIGRATTGSMASVVQPVNHDPPTTEPETRRPSSWGDYREVSSEAISGLALLKPHYLFAVTAVLSVIGAVCILLYLRHAKKRGQDEEEDTVPELDRDAVFRKRQEIYGILSAHMHALLNSRLEVRHLMSRQLATVSPKASADDARRLMNNNKLRHLLVCDGDQLVGIISDRDTSRTDAVTAGQMMTPNPICVEHDTQINPAVTMLLRRRISCLPVKENDRLCGVLTTTDLMMALQCTFRVLTKVAAEVTTAPTRDANAPSASNVPFLQANLGVLESGS